MMIESSRLILRKPELGDFDRFWDMVNDPIAKQYTGGVTTLNYNQRLELFASECAEEFSSEGAEFAVIQKDSGKYLGYCGFRFSDELDGNEFLYGFCRDSWGNGYGFEAAHTALTALFRSYMHDTYISTVHAENAASIRILEKLEFIRREITTSADAGHPLQYILRKKNFALLP